MDAHHLIRRPPAAVRPRAASAGAWLLLSLAVALLATQVVLSLSGYRTLVIRSGSMQPTLGVGDAVLSRSASPGEVRVGQLVTFRDPARNHTLVTHRVIRRGPAGPTVWFETRGDANRVSERWTVPATDSIGLVTLRIPRIGWVLAGLQTGWVRSTLIGLVSAWAAVVLLRRVWVGPS